MMIFLGVEIYRMANSNLNKHILSAYYEQFHNIVQLEPACMHALHYGTINLNTECHINVIKCS